MNIICFLVTPITFAASISPLSTSRRAYSIKRAYNGSAAIARGTIEAVVSIVVPTINLVKGYNKINRIIYEYF